MGYHLLKGPSVNAALLEVGSSRKTSSARVITLRCSLVKIRQIDPRSYNVPAKPRRGDTEQTRPLRVSERQESLPSQQFVMYLAGTEYGLLNPSSKRLCCMLQPLHFSDYVLRGFCLTEELPVLAKSSLAQDTHIHVPDEAQCSRHH